jgi:hypothetical protein
VRQSLLVLVPTAGLLIGSAAAPATTPVGAQTSESPTPERRCFLQQQISNFTSQRTGVLYLKVQGANAGTYRLSTSGACLDLGLTHQLSITPQLGSGRLCAGDWATVAAPGMTGSPQVCRALIGKRLTEDEITALPPRDRP